jgi:hypothetical protein
MSLKKVIIQATKKAPEISLDPEGMIRIKGRSMSGDWTEFSKKIDLWIDEYINDPADTTCVDICLEYFNEINLYVYISLLKKVESVRLKDKKYIINWYYEEGDEDILEKGENISYILNIPFNFIKIHDPLLPAYNAVNQGYLQLMKIENR